MLNLETKLLKYYRIIKRASILLEKYIHYIIFIATLLINVLMLFRMSNLLNN